MAADQSLTANLFVNPLVVDPNNSYTELANPYASPVITVRNGGTKLSSLANNTSNQLFVSNFKALTFSPDNVTSYTAFVVQVVVGRSLQDAFSVGLAIYNPLTTSWSMTAVNICYQLMVAMTMYRPSPVTSGTSPSLVYAE